MIHAKDLGFSFGESILFKSVDFHLKSEEFVSILGKSGCGKSTFLKLLSGVYPIQKGQIHMTEAVKSGIVFQDALLLPWLSVKENILLPFHFQSQEKFDSEWLHFLAQRLNLLDALNLFPHQLSGGMKMRAALLRSLIEKPKILFCDEPLSALDEWTREEAQDLFLELKSEFHLSCVFITHSISEAVYLSDRILIFSKQEKGFSREILYKKQSSLGFKRTDVAFVQACHDISVQMKELK